MLHWSSITSHILINISDVRPTYLYGTSTLSNAGPLVGLVATTELEYFPQIWFCLCWFRIMPHWSDSYKKSTKFPDTENVTIWWRHRAFLSCLGLILCPVITDSSCFWCSIMDPALQITGFYAVGGIKQNIGIIIYFPLELIIEDIMDAAYIFGSIH